MEIDRTIDRSKSHSGFFVVFPLIRWNVTFCLMLGSHEVDEIKQKKTNEMKRIKCICFWRWRQPQRISLVPRISRRANERNEKKKNAFFSVDWKRWTGRRRHKTIQSILFYVLMEKNEQKKECKERLSRMIYSCSVQLCHARAHTIIVYIISTWNPFSLF